MIAPQARCVGWGEAREAIRPKVAQAKQRINPELTLGAGAQAKARLRDFRARVWSDLSAGTNRR